MHESVIQIPLIRLTMAFLPVAIVVVLFFRWSLGARHLIYALARMLVQLLLVGYFLVYIFAAGSGWTIVMTLAVMLCAAGWISLRTVAGRRARLFPKALGAIAAGGGLTLALVAFGVLALEPWYLPQYMVPLAGMIFANSMNSVSLAAERFEVETARGAGYEQARATAFRISLIPIINALLAVGIVSLPGMMTGQILAGVSPFIAARYQIMVMCMIFGSAGLSSAIFLRLIRE